MRLSASSLANSFGLRDGSPVVCALKHSAMTASVFAITWSRKVFAVVVSAFERDCQPSSLAMRSPVWS